MDGSRSEPLSHAVIIVAGNRIQTVAQDGRVSLPSHARVIEARGKFIIPGFIDAHVHYREWMPELFLRYGVTSIIDMGNPADWILAQRDGIRLGRIPGPRIFSGGSFVSVAEEPSGDPRPISQALDALVEARVDLVRIGANLPRDSLEVLIREAHRRNLPVAGNPLYLKQALAAGMDYFQHSYCAALALSASDRELEEIRKGTMPEDKFAFPAADYRDLIGLIVEKKAFFNPVLASDWKVMHGLKDAFESENLGLLKNPQLGYLPVKDLAARLTNHSEFGIPLLFQPKIQFGSLDVRSAKHARFRKAFLAYQAFLKALDAAGGGLVAGTDSPNYVLPGISLHQELQLLVDAGLSPASALKAATERPAALLRKGNELGKIQEGYLADFLILGKNPLEDIRNTREIEAVFKDGRLIDTSYHRSFTNPIPRPPGIPEYTANPVPVVRSMRPSVAVEGAGDARLNVQGAGFVPGATVKFNGVRLKTSWLDDTGIVATCPARLLSRVGTFPVRVVNPRPGGGESKPAYFIVKFQVKESGGGRHARQ